MPIARVSPVAHRWGDRHEDRNHRLTLDDGNAMPLRQPACRRRHCPRFLVIHYTGRQQRPGTISWFQNPQSKVSAHLVIARDGKVTQMVPFNREAWHAGQSRWAACPGSTTTASASNSTMPAT